MKISFFQERSGSCDLDASPLCTLLCWSVDHPVPTLKIPTSSLNGFSLPHLKAGVQRSSADVHRPFLAGMSALNNRNSNSRETKATGLPPTIRKSAVGKLESTAASPHHLSRGYRMAHQPLLLQGGMAAIRPPLRSPP